MLLAIRGGGHNGPGLGSCDDGLVIDLSMMKSVRVDPASRTVRVEPGCSSADVDHATHAFGLAVPFGIVGSTGVAGLTLGGGTGYLTRKFGLTVDNLLEADVVLADGRFVTANGKEHPELFWALRGGGGNFGVVTSFLFQAHPVSMVFAGPIFWDAAKDGKAVMRAFRDFLPSAPEDLGTFVGLKTVPPTDPFPKEHWNKRACAVISCFNGSEAEGAKAMAPLLEGLPAPLFDWMGMMPMPAINGLFDPFFPKGLQWYWKGDFVKSLTDQAIDVHIAQAAEAPSPFCLMHLYPIDGAVRRVAKNATAWSTRDATYSMVIAGIDPDPKNAERLEDVGARLLEGRPPVQPGRRVRELHDGRRGRRAGAGDLRRKLRAAGVDQGEVRPEEPVPGEPEHQAGLIGRCRDRGDDLSLSLRPSNAPWPATGGMRSECQLFRRPGDRCGSAA